MQVLEGRARWLLARGIDQWRPSEFAEEAEAGIRRGEVFLWWRGSEAAGVFTLRRFGPAIWPHDPAAVYLHRIATSLAFKGENTGVTLIQLAIDQAKREGASRVRLDCWAGNQKLFAFYRRTGFRHVKDVATSRGFTVSLFERSV